MSEGAQTLHDVYETIEEIFGSYGERRLNDLIRRRDMSDSDLHVARGKAQATEELVRDIRNALGYDHTQL